MGPSKHILEVQHLQLKLFRSHPLRMEGDIFIQRSKHMWAKRHHAELRGTTIVVFCNAAVAKSEAVKRRDVVTVISVPHHKSSVVAHREAMPCIHFSSTQGSAGPLIFVKISGYMELEAWTKALANCGNVLCPDLRDITFHAAIGRGGGGRVFAIRWRKENKDLAVNVVKKETTPASSQKLGHAMTERKILEKVGEHPFVLQLEFAFQTREYLFIGTSFCAGGDLGTYLDRNGVRTAPCTVPDILCFQSLPLA